QMHTRPSISESIAEWENEMALVEKKNTDALKKEDLNWKKTIDYNTLRESRDCFLPFTSFSMSSSDSFPGTLLPVLAVCIVPPMTFVLVFFACTYCILVRRSSLSSDQSPSSPSVVQVQPVPQQTTAPSTEMHLGYVIMCVMFGLMMTSFLLFHILLPYTRLGSFSLRQSVPTTSVNAVTVTPMSKMTTDNFNRI
ncbi:hypothetical protein PMAYCL1PPCAC_17420, partial [Pristionchus mayeri]